MTTLVKIILGLTLSFLVAQSSKREQRQNFVYTKSTYSAAGDSIELRAYKILTNKCNVCHVERNRRRVFTKENMNPWAADVYKQTFIKKRMPKGKKIKLTNQEYQELLTWITSTKNHNNGI
ncbi:hypothetical protein [Aquimarina algiphila]|uniref:hypothetical protein n=1 Tax=Aquimarina algiphila TaxID=2047982 RepID=UPI00232C7D59|nr:hypothetical protein [Aquimarina algiphila]